jgi:hypothetical protein
MDKNIDDLFRLAQIYKPQSVGVEVTGQQGGFISWIQDEMLRRNIYFTLATENNSNKPGIRPVTNKMERFNVVVPWFKLGRIWFPTEKKEDIALQELMEELRLVSATGFKAKHDDGIDTINMLAAIVAWKPSEEANFSKEPEDRYWELEIEPEINNLHSYIV